MFKPSNSRIRRPAARSHIPRREQRINVTRSATIRPDDGRVIPCTLRDMHTRGARISVANAESIPETFELICRSVDLHIGAKVAWRRSNEIGVSFFKL